LYFPHPLLAQDSGLLAFGGDLSTRRLLLAYQHGIFPWFNEPPVCWYFTWPRAVIFYETLHISKNMRKMMREQPYRLTFNQAFNSVDKNCSSVSRPDQIGTWITEDIITAYTSLHHMGYAHSVEVWDGEELVAGLYGVLWGKIFYGESMFTLRPNGSKYGFLFFAKYLFEQGCVLIDCQQDTQHMASLGTVLLSKEEFWEIVKANRMEPSFPINMAL